MSLSSINTPTTTLKEKMHHNSDEEVYYEPLIYDNKVKFSFGKYELKPSVEEMFDERFNIFRFTSSQLLVPINRPSLKKHLKLKSLKKVKRYLQKLN